MKVKRTIGLSLCLAIMGTSLMAETYHVDAIAGSDLNDGSMGAPWQTIHHAVANSVDDDVILVAAGSYDFSSLGTVTVDKRLNILGPQDGVDPSQAAGLRTPGDAAEAVISLGGALSTAFTIADDSVTISGFDFNTALNQGNVIQTNGVSAWAGITVSYNIIRYGAAPVRTSPPHNAIHISNALAPTVSHNSMRNIAGGNTASNENLTGVIGLYSVSNGQVFYNEIFQTGRSDRTVGIHLNAISGATLVAGNHLHGNIGKNAFMFDGGNSGIATITDNVVEDFTQTAFSIQSPNYIIERNFVSGGWSNAIMQAAVYIRDSSVSGVAINHNTIGPTAMGGTSRAAGIRLQNFSGSSATISLAGNNLQGNINISASSDDIGLGWDAAAAASIAAQNCWWGHSDGPTRVASGTFNASGFIDGCTSHDASTNAGPGAGVGANGAGRQFCFEPWALFRLEHHATPSTGGTFGQDVVLNDLYTQHSITLGNIPFEDLVIIRSPDERVTEAAVEAVANAVAFELASGSSLIDDAVITVEYNPATDLGAFSESEMRLHKWNPMASAWELVSGSSVDEVDNTVTGTVSELGVYAAIGAVIPPPSLDGITISDADGMNDPLAGFTNDATVTVTFGTVGGDADTVEISEDGTFMSGVTSAAYAMQASEPFTLSGGDGDYTVWARVLGPGGNSTPTSNSITLDTTAPGEAVGGELAFAGGTLSIDAVNVDFTIEFNEGINTFDGASSSSGLTPDAVDLSASTVDTAGLNVSVMSARGLAGPFTINVSGTVPGTGDLTVGFVDGSIVDDAGNAIPSGTLSGINESVTLTTSVSDWSVLD